MSPSNLLTRLWTSVGDEPSFTLLRAPEIGLVMTRGRVGGTGAQFNLGEATAVRCSVRLSTGEVGHSYALGRDKRKAEIAALCDALLQTERAEEIRAKIIAPIEATLRDAREAKARKAAATKVEFFTMTRGEDD